MVAFNFSCEFDELWIDTVGSNNIQIRLSRIINVLKKGWTESLLQSLPSVLNLKSLATWSWDVREGKVAKIGLGMCTVQGSRRVEEAMAISA